MARGRGKHHSKRLQLERLEDRRLLAGNVLAAVLDGDLRVQGDEQGNSIEIFQTGPTSYLVRGNFTTVNGGPSFTATGVTDDIAVALGAGNDDAGLGLAVAGDLILSTGEGDDALSLGGFFELPPGAITGSVEVGGDLAVLLGAGNDSLTSLDTIVHGRAGFDFGDGDDSLFMVFNTFDREVGMLGRGGNDSFFIEQSTFAEEVGISAGDGDDSVALIASTFRRRVVLSGGAGFDSLDTSGSTFQGGLTHAGFESVV